MLWYQICYSNTTSHNLSFQSRNLLGKNQSWYLKASNWSVSFRVSFVLFSGFFLRSSCFIESLEFEVLLQYLYSKHYFDNVDSTWVFKALLSHGHFATGNEAADSGERINSIGRINFRRRMSSLRMILNSAEIVQGDWMFVTYARDVCGLFSVVRSNKRFLSLFSFCYYFSNRFTLKT